MRSLNAPGDASAGGIHLQQPEPQEEGALPTPPADDVRALTAYIR